MGKISFRNCTVEYAHLYKNKQNALGL